MKNKKEIALILEPVILDVMRDTNEIISLVESAGATVYGVESQNIRIINPATVFGSGKLAEINEKLSNTDVNLIVYDGDLSPSQTLNISQALSEIKVIDRTTLILDIFAQNAKSNEGRLQVELAQLKYLYPRLKGKGSALSRQSGGIGSKGPGETQLETDRRYIRARIITLERQLESLKNRRELQSYNRKRNSQTSIAIVGYTNVGKSTLINALTGSNVLVENKLFATLDSTVRRLNLGKYEVLITDTVGFVKDIPTTIIEAFKSTLESAVDANLILIVADINDNYEEQILTTNKILQELDCQVPIITVYNKCDNLLNYNLEIKDGILISAKTGLGLDKLKQAIIKELDKFYSSYKLKLSYSDFSALLKLNGFIESKTVEYKDDSVDVEICIKSINKSKFISFIK